MALEMSNEESEVQKERLNVSSSTETYPILELLSFMIEVTVL